MEEEMGFLCGKMPSPRTRQTGDMWRSLFRRKRAGQRSEIIILPVLRRRRPPLSPLPARTRFPHPDACEHLVKSSWGKGQTHHKKKFRSLPPYSLPAVFVLKENIRKCVNKPKLTKFSEGGVHNLKSGNWAGRRIFEFRLEMETLFN